jgi:hypothetical protein
VIPPPEFTTMVMGLVEASSEPPHVLDARVTYCSDMGYWSFR